MIRQHLSELLVVLFVLISRALVVADSWVAPVLTIGEVSETNALFVLQAWPGDYVLEASTDLRGVWSGLTNLSVGRGGAVKAAIPFLEPKHLFLRAVGLTPSDGAGCLAQFQTLGSTFEPEVRCDDSTPAGFVWIWSDGTTNCDYPIASKDFGAAGARVQGLQVDPSTCVTSINLGFDGSDGGGMTPLSHRPPQSVAAVRFPYPLTNLHYWASSYNPITNTLDFSGFNALETIECFYCTNLQHVLVTNLPALRRACFEGCPLTELDLSGNPNFEDLRGALGLYTNIVVGRGTGPKIWHWCTRDNPRLTQRFQDFMTNYYSLKEMWIHNDNQTGEFRVGSTNLVEVYAANNDYTSAHLSGNGNLVLCDFQNNKLTNIAVTGCSGLRYLYLNRNSLDSSALDALLAELDNAAPLLQEVRLSQNAQRPSAVGYAHYTNLTAKGVWVTLDWPPADGGSNSVAGGTNAITFVTISSNPHMEIRVAAGTTPTILWHWGDGTTLTNSGTAGHDFGTTGMFTNYVEVIPPESVTYFGAQYLYPGQGIRAVYGARNFPNLNFLYLYLEDLTDLSIAGCSNLVQLHLAGTHPFPAAVCDQWFIDLDSAVSGPVVGADFFYPANLRSSRSDAACASLVNKGYMLHPW